MMSGVEQIINSVQGWSEELVQGWSEELLQIFSRNDCGEKLNLVANLSCWSSPMTGP